MWFGNHVVPGFVTGSLVVWDWLWNQEGTGPLGAHLGVGGSHGTPRVLQGLREATCSHWSWPSLSVEQVI